MIFDLFFHLLCIRKWILLINKYVQISYILTQPAIDITVNKIDIDFHIPMKQMPYHIMKVNKVCETKGWCVKIIFLIVIDAYNVIF